VRRILFVDDTQAATELLATELRSRLAAEVVTAHTIAGLGDVIAAHGPFDLALVDLLFPQERRTGIDALLAIHLASPSTALVVITQGDDLVADVLRDAYDLFPLATAISKSATLGAHLDLVAQVLARGSAPVDPVLRPLLPHRRNPNRSLESFRRLVPHAGHAKLWRALFDPANDSYRALAAATGLKMNTIKNYRAQIAPELAAHGLHDGTMRQMQEFAMRVRGVLEPTIAAALGEDG
jgi:DNA-binding NarL/FixJ family response regulator